MKTGHIIVIFLLAVFAAAPINAQNYNNLFHDEMSRKNALEKQRQDLKSSIAKLNTGIKEAQGKIKQLRKDSIDVARDRADSEKELGELNYFCLMDEKKRCEAVIDSLHRELVKLRESLSLARADVEAKQERSNSLDSVRLDVVNDIVRKYGDYLNLSFSDMKASGLDKITNECNRYSDAPELTAFREKTAALTEIKAAYDNAAKVVNSPYDKSNVDAAIKSLHPIAVLTPQQKSEVASLIDQLKAFPQGLKAFQTYITELNKNRASSAYMLDDFETDEPHILEKVGKNMDHLHKVPYLEKQFNAYRAAIRKHPDSHPSIEEEILNQKQ